MEPVEGFPDGAVKFQGESSGKVYYTWKKSLYVWENNQAKELMSDLRINTHYKDIQIIGDHILYCCVGRQLVENSDTNILCEIDGSYDVTILYLIDEENKAWVLDTTETLARS